MRATGPGRGTAAADRPARRGRRPWVAVAAVMFGVGWGANQFTSLIVAYHQHRGLTTATDDALFGIYALGLVPALLLCGPAADRWGRRRVVGPAALTSVAATVLLMAGAGATPLLYLGRFVAGAVSGAVFAAGTAWVKELSLAPHDPGAGEQAGARRAAIALSLGFGLGPLVAGVVAQWSPAPLVVAYLPHLAVMAAVLPGLRAVPETVPAGYRTGGPGGTGPGGWWARLRVPRAGRHRFRTVVVPLAPWVFAAASVSFAVLPSVVSTRTHGLGVAFAGVVAGVTLAVGVLVQPVARRLDRVDSARAGLAGLAAVVAGLVVAAAAARWTSPALVVAAAVVLGAGYGGCLVAGLQEVQRLAGPDELAGVTAVFYALTYVGFAVPSVLAEAERVTGTATLLLALAALAAGCLAVVAVGDRRPQVDSMSPRPK